MFMLRASGQLSYFVLCTEVEADWSARSHVAGRSVAHIFLSTSILPSVILWGCTCWAANPDPGRWHSEEILSLRCGPDNLALDRVVLCAGASAIQYRIGDDVSILDLAEMVAATLNPQIEIRVARLAAPKGPVPRYVPCVDRAREMLGLRE